MPDVIVLGDDVVSANIEIALLLCVCVQCVVWTYIYVFTSCMDINYHAL